MKSLLLALLCTVNLAALAQDQYGTLYLNVKDSDGEPVRFTDLYLTNQTTNEDFTGTTDGKGKVHFRVEPGVVYRLFFDKSKIHAEYTIPKYGSTIVTKTVTYNPLRKWAEGEEIVFDTVQQDIPLNHRPNRAEAMLVLKIKRRSGRALADFPVTLVSKDRGKVYQTTTNRRGEARFLISPDSRNQISMEGWDNFRTVIFPDYPGGTLARSFTFEPTEVEETWANDTVTQALEPGQGPTTARFMVNVFVHNYGDQPLAGEQVIAQAENGGPVFIAKTNNSGFAKLLLPKQYVYNIHLKYESYLDHYDFRDKRGFGEVNITCAYRGSQAIEEFYAQANRDENGLITEFMEGKADLIPEKPKYEIVDTDDGFVIKFPDSDEQPTPGIVDGQILMADDIYSPEFHSFDAENGEHQWTLRLSEGGASSVTSEDGMLLINTESCTIYAIDSKTGQLAWSKWLSNYLWTTPTVKDGRVFAVFGNDLGDLHLGARQSGIFAFACFDLKTGKILWQERLETEGMGAPVVAGEKVYLTTVNGKLHVLDAVDGKNHHVNDGRFTCPPTVVNDRVYISQKTNSGLEQSVVADAKSLNILQQFPELSNGQKPQEMHASYPVFGMHFQGSRVLHVNGLNYQVFNGTLVCWDAKTGKKQWSQIVGADQTNKDLPKATMPVVAGNKIVVSNQGGDIMTFQAQSGKKLSTWTTGGTLWSQPVIDKGRIYSGGSGEGMTCIETGDPQMTGWPIWGMNGSHNPVVSNVETN